MRKLPTLLRGALLYLIAAVSISTTSAQAPVTHIINEDQKEPLTGAQNVLVNGTLYDVTFLGGTCIDIFDGCEEAADFEFTDEATAKAAAQALIDQVFIDIPAGAFDSDPYLTNSCTMRTSRMRICNVNIPYRRVRAGEFGTVNTAVAFNADRELRDIVGKMGRGVSDDLDWAKFVLAGQ